MISCQIFKIKVSILAMTLYIYDHCPYCVKARMIFPFKKQSLKIKTLLNDDEKTPHSMIGAKMVPILEYKAGKFMPESMDIVDYVDGLSSPKQVQNKENKKLMDWLGQNSLRAYKLAMPRWVKAPLEEFQTKSAKSYFKKKKEAYIGSFQDCLKESQLLIEEMEKELLVLESFFKGKQKFFLENLSLNDFHLFAFLRSLSVVQGLSFPPKTKFYMEELSKNSLIPLHFSIAL